MVTFQWRRLKNNIYILVQFRVGSRWAVDPEQIYCMRDGMESEELNNPCPIVLVILPFAEKGT